MQAAVPVLPGDDEAALAARVLAQRARDLPAGRALVRRGRSCASSDGVVRHADGAPQLLLMQAPCIPNALLDLPPNCCARVLKFDAAGRRASSRPSSASTARSARASATRWPRRPTRCCAGACCYQHLAQSGSGAAGAAPGDPRLAGQRTASCARALGAARAEVAGRRSQAIDRADAARQAAPQPARLAGRSRCSAQLGDDEFWPLVGSLDEPAPLDLRVNTLKAKREDGAGGAGRGRHRGRADAVLAVGPARRTASRRCTSSTLFTRGDVEVQDEGSQLLALLTDAKRGEMVVDFCAGAGGKTLALGAAMRNTGRLYAFDVSGHRLDALKPRLARSGLSNVHPVQIAHERDERIKRLAGKIDRVLVDAPCSGPRHAAPQPRPEVAPVAASGGRNCSAKQAAILASAARLLKPGGRLVYATCSLLRAENEARRRGVRAGARRSSTCSLAQPGCWTRRASTARPSLVSGRQSAPVAASAWHRRLLRGGLAT